MKMSTFARHRILMDAQLPVANPFQSSQLRPGLIPFVFAGGDSFVALLERFEEQRFRGLIIGPHGSGKSTLLHQVEQWIVAQGGTARRVCLRPETRWQGYRELWLACRNRPPAEYLLIDGFEQLPAFFRWISPIIARVFRIRVLATAHQPGGLPVVLRTDPLPDQAMHVIDMIMSLSARENTAQRRPDASMLRRLLVEHHGSVREVMFRLYDQWNLSDTA